MMKITKLEFALVSAIVIIIASACFYCWPSKVIEKTQTSNTQVPVVTVKEVAPGEQKQELKKIYGGIEYDFANVNAVKIVK